MRPKPSRRAKSQDDSQDAWLMTYADLITQLMCFFVLLLIVSDPHPEKMGEVLDGLASGFVPDTISTPYEGFYKSTENWIEAEGMAVDAAVERIPHGVAVDLSGDLLFAPGSAAPNPAMRQKLALWSQTLKLLPQKQLHITISGYTDDGSPGAFGSLWELSAARAATLAKLLVGFGLPPETLVVEAYGATHARVPNRDEGNHPIPENQAKNRRVVVKVERLYN